jgi:hypothetical protein
MMAAPVSDLPAPGLAHHAQDFAGRDGEGNVVQRAQGAAAVRKLDDEVFDF